MPLEQPHGNPLVVGLGEVLWDCFPDRHTPDGRRAAGVSRLFLQGRNRRLTPPARLGFPDKSPSAGSRRPGGAPANVAFHAAQLGYRGVVLSRVGEDDDGDELVGFLRERGLDVSHIQRDPRHATGRVTVTLTGGQPEFHIHEDAAWDHLAFDEPTRALMEAADAVCFGTLAQRSPESRETIHRCLAATLPECLVVYDVNLRQSWYEREWIERSLAASRMVKLNAEEAVCLGPLLELGVDASHEVAQALRSRFDVETVCITRGAEGALVVSPEGTVDVPGIPVEVVDTVGAGDAFTAALIAGHLRGWPIERTAEFAGRVGSLVAARPGGMPELREEFRGLG